MNKKGIFRKYFGIVYIIICVGFIFLAAVQSVVSAKFWVSEKEKLLTSNAITVAANVSANARPSPIDENHYTLHMDDGNIITVLINSISVALDSDVLITDNRGVIVTTSQSELSGPHLTADFSDLIKEDGTINSGFVSTKLGNYYGNTHFVSGANIEKNGNQIGYVFIATPTASLFSYLTQNLMIYFLSALATLAISCIVVYFVTDRLTSPLRDMVAAARKFGEGDFSTRLSVKGQDEIAELAASLNGMANSLGSVESVNRNFIANVSHDLRTPMTTISGFVDGILDGTIPPEKEEYYLSIVSDEVHRLSRVVKAMLNISRIDNQTLLIQKENFDLSAMAGSILMSFEKRINDKQIEILDIDECPSLFVDADPDLLGQVVYNLIDNAVKFTNIGGTISLKIKESTDKISFKIRNSGDGISQEEMPHIFERFYKSDHSRSKDKTGTGLGLFIVKSVINLHHGDIYVRSIQGEYCEFEFWIPKIDSIE